jgi:hypothetical protein
LRQSSSEFQILAVRGLEGILQGVYFLAVAGGAVPSVVLTARGWRSYSLSHLLPLTNWT